MSSELQGRFLNRQPLKGRFPKQRPSRKNIDTEPLSFFRGDTIRLGLQVFDETGIPLDLTDVQTIKSTWKEEECLLQCTLILELGDPDEIGHGTIEVLDAPNGRVQIEIPPEVSQALLPISYVFDVEVTMNDGTVGTVLKRFVEITGDITEVFPPPPVP